MDKLTQLKTFVRVVECASFSAAARSLAVTQPAVSKAIGAIEKELGIRLVNRSTRSVSLTVAGRRYYARCRDILADLDEAEASLKAQTASLGGTLRIAAPVPFGVMFVSPLVARFGAMYPGITVSLDLSDRFTNLVEVRVDVAIRLGHIDAPGTVVRKLGESPFVAVASPAYLAAHGTPTTPGALASHQCLTYSIQTAPLEWRFEGAPVVRVPSRYRSNNLLALKEAALCGIGISRLPLWMVDAEIGSGRLVRILEQARLPTYAIHAVFPSVRQIPARVGAFVDFIRDEFAGVGYFQAQRPPGL